MPEEGEKKGEVPRIPLIKAPDINLKPIEKSAIENIPPPFQNKPLYIDILINAIRNPILEYGEYIKVPFNPVTEHLSRIVIDYFLGTFAVKPNEFPFPEVTDHGETIKPPNCLYMITEVFDILPEKPRIEDMRVIYTQKPYLFIVATNEIYVLYSDLWDTIIDKISNKFGFDKTNIAYMCSKHDGILFLFGNGIDQDTIILGTDLIDFAKLANTQWEKTLLTLNLSRINKTYQITIYYKEKDKQKGLAYIPTYEIIEIIESIISYHFKEKKI